MPIWLRRFTFQKLKDHYSKVNEESENIVKNNTQQTKNILKPNIRPAYNTKASPK